MMTNTRIEKKTEELKNELQAAIDKEKQIQAEFGFSGHAVPGLGFTKSLKVNGVPTMFAAFSHPQFYTPKILAEIVSLCAAKSQADGVVAESYPMPYAVTVQGERQQLRIRIDKVERMAFIEHMDIFGYGIYPDPDTDSYIVRVADILNILPGEDNYVDFGQMSKKLDLGQLKERWTQPDRSAYVAKARKFDLAQALAIPGHATTSLPAPTTTEDEVKPRYLNPVVSPAEAVGIDSDVRGDAHSVPSGSEESQLADAEGGGPEDGA